MKKKSKSKLALLKGKAISPQQTRKILGGCDDDPDGVMNGDSGGPM